MLSQEQVERIQSVTEGLENPGEYDQSTELSECMCCGEVVYSNRNSDFSNLISENVRLTRRVTELEEMLQDLGGEIRSMDSP